MVEQGVVSLKESWDWYLTEVCDKLLYITEHVTTLLYTYLERKSWKMGGREVGTVGTSSSQGSPCDRDSSNIPCNINIQVTMVTSHTHGTYISYNK